MKFGFSVQSDLLILPKSCEAAKIVSAHARHVGAWPHKGTPDASVRRALGHRSMLMHVSSSFWTSYESLECFWDASGMLLGCLVHPEGIFCPWQVLAEDS
jgi:hypothetical protein